MNPPEAAQPVVAQLAARIEAGDRRALARGISWLEGGLPQGRALLEALRPAPAASQVIGVTGPPGSGKSTLLGMLADSAGSDRGPIGVLAVDPSSPWSGGAILGDRIRLAPDPGLFFRSLASRGALGGLARAVEGSLRLMASAGHRLVLVETVGVGQSEVEVAEIADTVVVVLCPGLGDEIQAIKAGLLELADVFVVHKADRPQADRLAAELEPIAAWSAERRGWRPPVVMSQAGSRAAAAAVWSAIDRHLEQGLAHGPQARGRLVRSVRSRLEGALDRWLRGCSDEKLRALAQHDRRRIESLVAGLLERLDPTGARAPEPAFRLDHVAFAAPELEPVAGRLQALFGFERSADEAVESMAIRASYLQAGAASLELVEPLGSGGPLDKFLDRRGAALHHVCLRVRDLPGALQRLAAAGVRLIDQQPRRGVGGAWIAFLHPSSTAGILIELKEDSA